MTTSTSLRTTALVTMLACTLAPGCAADEFKAAGVFAWTMRGGRPTALLGEEMRSECAGYCWSDFVGGRKQAPGGTRLETVVETAAREFHQETRHSYDRATLRSELAGLEPLSVAGGRVRIFLLEVADRDAAEMARRPPVVDDEKDRYCWLDLEALLAAVDGSAGDEVALLRSCGGNSARFFAPVVSNLRRDGVLRPHLDALLAAD